MSVQVGAELRWSGDKNRIGLNIRHFWPSRILARLKTNNLRLKTKQSGLFGTLFFFLLHSRIKCYANRLIVLVSRWVWGPIPAFRIRVCGLNPKDESELGPALTLTWSSCRSPLTRSVIDRSVYPSWRLTFVDLTVFERVVLLVSNFCASSTKRCSF